MNNIIFDLGDRVIISKETFEELKRMYLADYMGDSKQEINKILEENEK